MNLRDYKQIEIEPIIDITIYKQNWNWTYNRLEITGRLKKGKQIIEITLKLKDATNREYNLQATWKWT